MQGADLQISDRRTRRKRFVCWTHSCSPSPKDVRVQEHGDPETDPEHGAQRSRGPQHGAQNMELVSALFLGHVLFVCTFFAPMSAAVLAVQFQDAADSVVQKLREYV